VLTSVSASLPDEKMRWWTNPWLVTIVDSHEITGQSLVNVI